MFTSMTFSQGPVKGEALGLPTFDKARTKCALFCQRRPYFRVRPCSRSAARVWLIVMGWMSLTSSVRAGLYLSSESYADLPAQWRGFLLDQRNLRQIAVPAGPKIAAS